MHSRLLSRMVRNEDRESHVSVLRQCAKDAKCADTLDNKASKSKVATLIEAIRSSRARKSIKDAAEKAYNAYLATFIAVQGETESKSGHAQAEATCSVAPAVRSIRLRGVSFLTTYNWDFFGKRLPDGTEPFSSSQSLWKSWRNWKAL
jgi:hypothetical protein